MSEKKSSKCCADKSIAPCKMPEKEKNCANKSEKPIEQSKIPELSMVRESIEPGF